METTPTFRSTAVLSGSVLLMALALLVPARSVGQGTATDGRRLFLNRCAHCHGANGQGGSTDPAPLTGTLSVTELARFIKKSMPPGPQKCPAADADKIAAYIYDAFFSPVAQERIRPARVGLVRMTVRQFKNAVSDLVSGYKPVVPPGEVHGLHADYFKGRSRDVKNRVIERIDPDINFDFGTAAPEPGLFDAHNFSIAWQGSILAPDSGDYEFSIHSKHSVQLWLNGSRYPVVDGEVRSAGDADPHGSITLLGGRSYSMYMVFTKATQGVDSNQKNAPPAAESYVTLNWRRPKHILEPIPTQFLYKDWSPTRYVVTTPFPPDDRSTGYERGDTVSREWDDATTAAALESADYVSKHLPEVTGIPDADPNRQARLKSYCLDFVQRAFRRPITDDVKRIYIDKQFILAPNVENAVKRVVILTLKSPRFLYCEVGGRRDAYSLASQLSFGLWDTIPDPELLRAASGGGLIKRDQAMAQAVRMAGDRRTWNKLRDFLLLWLKVDETPDIVKSRKAFPDFDSAIASDLRTSLELSLESALWSKSSDYRDLMLSDKLFFNGRLAKVYGVGLPPNAPFQQVELNPGRRRGVITHPYLLARFAYLESSSPIHRGVLIERNLLGRVLSPPPANFAPLSAGTRPDLTTRERVSLQTRPQFCNSCHGIINPLGFTLERFDAIGRLRDRDNGKPIDDTGAYESRAGVKVKLAGALDLAHYLATSDDAHRSFVEKLFVHVVKQPPTAYSPTEIADLQQGFAKNQYSVRELLVDTVMASMFASDKVGQGQRMGKL
jgi:hypothetical protein